MKLLAWIFILVGLASILFGLGSCRHYYAVNPPPEAYQPGWDADAQAEPYIAFETFFYTMAGGVIAISLGLYLRRRVRPDFSVLRLAERLTILRPRFCPKCGKPLRARDCRREKMVGFIPRLVCADCIVGAEHSGALVFATGFILIFGGFLVFSFCIDRALIAFFWLISLPVGFGVCVIGVLRWDRQFRRAKRYISEHVTPSA